MNRKNKIILSVIGVISIVAVTLGTGFLVYLYVTNKPFEQTLATNLNVSSEWAEISPEPVLQTRRIVSEIGIALPNYRNDRNGGLEIKLSDGRVIQPQVQAVDVRGKVLDLRQSGFTYTGDHDLIIFTPQGGFPAGEYKTIRIRSDQPFTIERMFWRERNLK